MSDEAFHAAAHALDDELEHDHKRCAEIDALASMTIDMRMEAAAVSALHMGFSKDVFMKAAEAAYDSTLAEMRERAARILAHDAQEAGAPPEPSQA